MGELASTILVLHLALSGSKAAPVATVSEIVAAELAFAADTAARGPGNSFRRAVAPDAIAMTPDPESGRLTVISAKQRAESRPAPPAKPSELKWWPAFAGIARSGEIGFTTGPVIFPHGRGHGFVFTVWTKQPDGTWKYFFDGGPSTDGPSRLSPDMPPEILPVAESGAASAADATEEVAAIEAKIAARAATDSKRAYVPYLTDLSRLMGSGGQPTIGKADAARELNRRGKAIRFEPVGSRASEAGDLVFSYGRTYWEPKKHGGYTRIWQKSARGWRIILDQIQVPPPLAPPSAAVAQPGS